MSSGIEAYEIVDRLIEVIGEKSSENGEAKRKERILYNVKNSINHILADWEDMPISKTKEQLVRIQQSLNDAKEI